jgi:hypothetical protein
MGRIVLFLTGLCGACALLGFLATLLTVPPLIVGLSTFVIGVVAVFVFFKYISGNAQGGSHHVTNRKIGIVLCQIGVIVLIIALLNMIRQAGNVPITALIVNACIKIFLIFVLASVSIKAKKALNSAG